MSKAMKAIKALRQIFASPDTTDTSTVYKLNDGSEISVSKLEVGGTVTIAGTPAPANTYTLEDGTTLTVDASGVITAVGKPEAASKAEPPKSSEAAPQKFEITEEMKSPDGMRKLVESFASGTPEERIANLEMVCKALMEYSFGWEIRKAKEEADRAAAIKVYTDNLATTQGTVEVMKQAMSQMIPLLEELAGLPESEAPEGSKKKYSFSGNGDVKNKNLARYVKAIGEIRAGAESK